MGADHHEERSVRRGGSHAVNRALFATTLLLFACGPAMASRRTYVRMETSQRHQFGLNLATERKKAGLSQEDLAFRANLHRTEVSLIERGLREPRLETMLKLSRGLGVMPATLIEGIN